MAAQNGSIRPNGNLEAASLADILFSQGALTKERAEAVKIAEIQSGKGQEEILAEQKIVSEEALSKAKAALYNIPFVDLSVSPVAPDALASLPQEVADKFNVIPILIDRNKKEMQLAMADPLDLTAIEFVEQKTGLHIRPVAAVPSLIKDFIITRYAVSLSTEVTAAIKESIPDSAKKVTTLDLAQMGLVRDEGAIEKIVSEVLKFAMKARASDVHVEPEEKRTRIRYRIDGILHEKLTLPREFQDGLVSRIKILSGMKIDEKRIPQDGRFNFKSGGDEVDLRVSTLPTTWGEKVVMRLLKKSGGVPELTELGLRGRALSNLQDAILRPHGIIVVCGPTGSGKTTTLYSVLSKINTPKVNIVTLEDPVEYKIQGVNQVQVNPQAGLTFASGLRAFLRQDPNIIFVGEIRDRETADLAIQASLTGHLVFSTLHTNDASGALPRLLDMGAEPYLLASSMTAIVAQRVARKIHEDCREGYPPEPKVAEDLKKVVGNLWPEGKEMSLYKGKGDADCNNTGYLGRIGIFEVLPITEKVARLILERAPASSIQKQAVEEGMITMKQDGYLKALEGITSIEEILRVAQD